MKITENPQNLPTNERENTSRPSRSRFWKSPVSAHLRIALASFLFLLPVTDGLGELPKPDDALAKPTEIEFLTAISAQIDDLKSEQIAAYHAHLALPSGAPPSHIRTAKDLLEHHWAEIAPQALLEAVATGKARASNEAQALAPGAVVGGDEFFAAVVDVEAGVFPGEQVGEFSGADEFGVAEGVEEAAAEEFDGRIEVFSGHAVEAAVGGDRWKAQRVLIRTIFCARQDWG